MHASERSLPSSLPILLCTLCFCPPARLLACLPACLLACMPCRGAQGSLHPYQPQQACGAPPLPRCPGQDLPRGHQPHQGSRWQDPGAGGGCAAQGGGAAGAHRAAAAGQGGVWGGCCQCGWVTAVRWVQRHACTVSGPACLSLLTGRLPANMQSQAPLRNLLACLDPPPAGGAGAAGGRGGAAVCPAGAGPRCRQAGAAVPQ